MVIFANILLFIWSSKNCDIIYLKKKLKRIIGPDKLEEEAIRNLIFICMKQQCILRMERLGGLLLHSLKKYKSFIPIINQAQNIDDYLFISMSGF